VHPGAEELGRVYTPHLAIHAAPTAFAAAAEGLQPPNELKWGAGTKTAHADYLAWTEVPTEQPGGVNLGAVMVWLRENLPLDTILCNGAGNYAAWIHRFYRFRQFATQIAPTSASMGYGMRVGFVVVLTVQVLLYGLWAGIAEKAKTERANLAAIRKAIKKPRK
jgi:acetolactate synthase-1/2/3 large subunit